MTVLHDHYPSRTGDTPRVIKRQEPTVYAGQKPDGRFLNDDEQQSYSENGFLLKKSLFSDEEVAAFLRELKTLAGKPDLKDAPEAIQEPESGDVRSIFRIHELSKKFGELSRDPRILNVVRHLLDDDVYIHQSRANMKPGFAGKDFYWHSDFETWHVEDGMPFMRAISVSIALTPNYPFNGPLMLIPGSHTQFISCVGETPEDNYKESLRKQKVGTPDQDNLTWMADQADIIQATGPAGSVLFFECNVMHGSNSNITPFPRSNAFFVYNAMSNQLVEPFNGLKPRPEYIATRENVKPLRDLS